MALSPVRRVLGDKDRNAPVQASRSAKEAAGTVQTRANDLNTKTLKNMERLSSSPQAGSKRKIDEVEDAERVEHVNNNENDSQRTQLLSETDSNADDVIISNSTDAQPSYETAETSFSASQNTIEPQFELQHDEMSQRTLDKLNAVPLPQNTSQLPPLPPGLRNEMSAGSVGLSHFVHLEGPPSTQGSDGMLQPIEQDNRLDAKEDRNNVTNGAETTGDAARKQMLDQKAAELRTRLQLALYKVQTRQTSQPFSRLKPPKPTRRSPGSSPSNWMSNHNTPHPSSSTIRQQSSARTYVANPHDARTVDSAEAQIAAMRANAAMQAKPRVRDLGSLPMPQLDPSLMDSAGTLPQNAYQDYPSSPPFSREQSAAEDAQLLSGLREIAEDNARSHLSSPPVSEVYATTASLTKTVSQGEAASGLVQLMTAAQSI